MRVKEWNVVTQSQRKRETAGYGGDGDMQSDRDKGLGDNDGKQEDRKTGLRSIYERKEPRRTVTYGLFCKSCYWRPQTDRHMLNVHEGDVAWVEHDLAAIWDEPASRGITLLMTTAPTAKACVTYL